MDRYESMRHVLPLLGLMIVVSAGLGYIKSLYF
jgi:hypothetical protein